MTMVFHPHGWIRNDQMVELIDYAVAKHGKKVKFLTFKESLERLNTNLLDGHSVRHPDNAGDHGVRIFDLNNDGYMDRIIHNTPVRGKSKSKGNGTRVWDMRRKTWSVADSIDFITATVSAEFQTDAGVRFAIVRQQPRAFVRFTAHAFGPIDQGWTFNGRYWSRDTASNGLPLVDHPFASAPYLEIPVLTGWKNFDPAFRLLDLDADGNCEAILGYLNQRAVFMWSKKGLWARAPFDLPQSACFVDARGNSTGVRFVDLNGDGKLDIIFSNEKEYGIYLFTDMEKGWSKKILHGKRGESEPRALASGSGAAAAAALAARDELPMISRQGQNNGFWVHSGYLWWSNEDTVLLKDHVDRRKIAELLRAAEK